MASIEQVFVRRLKKKTENEFSNVPYPVLAHLSGLTRYTIDLKICYYAPPVAELKLRRNGCILGMYIHIASMCALLSMVFEPFKFTKRSITNSLLDMKEIDSCLSQIHKEFCYFLLKKEDIKTKYICACLEGILECLYDLCLDLGLDPFNILKEGLNQIDDYFNQVPVGPFIGLKPKYGKRGRPTKQEKINSDIKFRLTDTTLKHKYILKKPKYKHPGRPTPSEKRKFRRQMERYLLQQSRIKQEKMNDRLKSVKSAQIIKEGN